MISKEMLSKVLGLPCERITVSGTKVSIIHYNDIDIPSNWNIHELAHKCKEWSKENDYILSSGFIARCNDAYCEIFNRWDFETVPKHTTNDQTEPEAIFKACVWIQEHTRTIVV